MLEKAEITINVQVTLLSANWILYTRATWASYSS